MEAGASSGLTLKMLTSRFSERSYPKAIRQSVIGQDFPQSPPCAIHGFASAHVNTFLCLKADPSLSMCNLCDTQVSTNPSFTWYHCSAALLHWFHLLRTWSDLGRIIAGINDVWNEKSLSRAGRGRERKGEKKSSLSQKQLFGISFSTVRNCRKKKKKDRVIRFVCLFVCLLLHLLKSQAFVDFLGSQWWEMDLAPIESQLGSSPAHDFMCSGVKTGKTSARDVFQHLTPPTLSGWPFLLLASE